MSEADVDSQSSPTPIWRSLIVVNSARVVAVPIYNLTRVMNIVGIKPLIAAIVA